LVGVYHSVPATNTLLSTILHVFALKIKSLQILEIFQLYFRIFID